MSGEQPGYAWFLVELAPHEIAPRPSTGVACGHGTLQGDASSPAEPGDEPGPVQIDETTPSASEPWIVEYHEPCRTTAGR